MFLVVHQKKVGFIILSCIYFLIGIFLIFQTSITGDEPAYLGAAYAYSQGLGLNVEHPLLLKLINGASLKLFFQNLQVSVPLIDQIQNYDSAEGRLASFQVGYHLLMGYPEHFFNIIYVSRFGYLLFNSIFLIWLYFYTFVFKFINSNVSLIFLTLYIFSPSFYSHSFLATFDVPASLYGLGSILSAILLSFNLEKLFQKEILLHFIINTILIF
ncbi:glycosyl transferase [Aphanothece sacrum FPU3]|nr:glycosyl transferase [Aphanothece sacrum FPU3]